MSANPQVLASEWLRALRGPRSQVALSRRLGYRTNIAYRWEAGHCFPTAAGTLQLIEKVGGDVEVALGRFVHLEPAWSGPNRAASPQGVARFLQRLQGSAPVTALAKRAGISRYCASRWLKGSSELTLPDLLNLIEVMTGRLLDFIAVFTDPATLPSARVAWANLTEARELAYRLPWSHAVLRALELRAYLELPRHDSAWVAARIGASVANVEESLTALQRVGQVQRKGEHYIETAPDTVDTRAEPDRALGLKAWWAECGVKRLSQGAPGLLSFNLSAISRSDLERLQQIQRRAYREMSSVIASSSPAECVVLHSAVVLALDEDSVHEF